MIHYTLAVSLVPGLTGHEKGRLGAAYMKYGLHHTDYDKAEEAAIALSALPSIASVVMMQVTDVPIGTFVDGSGRNY